MTIPGEVCKMQANGRADNRIATTGSGSRRHERSGNIEPSGFDRRSVFARVPARSLSASRGAARGRARGLARAIRNMGDGPARAGPRCPDRLADLLLVGRRRSERFPQRAAMASAEHYPGGRSAAAHPHPRGADADPVAGGDQGLAGHLRARGGSADRAIGRTTRIRRRRRSGRSLSAESVPGRGRDFRGRPREPAALWQHGVQLVRSAQRPVRPGDGQCRPGSRLDHVEMQPRGAGAGRVGHADFRGRRCRRVVGGRSGHAGALVSFGRDRHHRLRARQRALLLGALSRAVAAFFAKTRT